ncbi:lipase precursor [Gongronella butleri]|nr:lipase precursor [Gongronella butleri]
MLSAQALVLPVRDTNGSVPALISSRCQLPSDIPSGNGSSQQPTAASSQQVSDAKFRLQFAALAYCSSVTSSKQWTSTMAKQALSDGQIQITFESTKYDTTGYIVTSASKKAIYVVFRGTISAQQWAADLEASLITYPAVSGAKIHSGFYNSYMEVQQQVVTTVANLLGQNPDYVVEVTGHSLGAAQSQVAYLDLYQRIESLNKDNLVSYTYGEPRVGDKSFAAYSSSTGITHNRVVHHADTVPNQPATYLGYLHSGLEYWITGVTGDSTDLCPADFESPYCSNSLAALDNWIDHLNYYGTQFGVCI